MAKGTRTRLAWALAFAIVAQTPATAEARAPLKVVVTTKPVHSLVSQVMDGVGTPQLLVSGASSPHTYALKPSDARALNEAELFFRVSTAVEPFTAKIAAALPASVRLVTLADIEGLVVLPRRSLELHEHEEAAAHDDHAHPVAITHAEDKNAADGHIWLDPVNARAMISAIATALSAADPENEARYRGNAAKASAALAALESEIKRELAPIRTRPFIVFHDAIQYFERRFELNGQGAITVSPEVAPSARRLTAVRHRIAQLGAVCVFAEPMFQSRLIDTVVEGTSAKAGVLDPEGLLLQPGADAYGRLLRGMAHALRQCLAQDG